MNDHSGTTRVERRNPWLWVPSTYFAEGVPYVLIIFVSVIMYKRLEISNEAIALYTGWLYLPFVIKPLWSPFVEMFRTKRFWILATELILGAGFASLAFTLQTDLFFEASLALFWILAFSAATQDVAVDGFYMLGLEKHLQAFFVGIRSTFFRVAMITGQGLLVMFAGMLEEQTDNIPAAWTVTFFVTAGLFGALFLYHFFVLPYPRDDKPAMRQGSFVADFTGMFAAYFRKPGIWIALSFLLLYRFSKSQIVKIVPLFQIDSVEYGGLGLATSEVGLLNTVAIISMLIAGILGGIVVSRQGLKYWKWWFVGAINVPHLLYVYLAVAQPGELWIVAAVEAVVNFGYGFGFAGYVVYMLYVAEGEFKTAHYALCAGFMAMGMMVPGMFTGWLQMKIGYEMFFWWTAAATIPSFLVTGLINVDPGFGRKDPSR